MKRSAIKRHPVKRKPGFDDPEYRAYILEFPCCVCVKLEIAQTTRTELHHAGDHGYGERPPDRIGVPLCVEHHTEGPFAVHGPIGRRFWACHGLDRDAIIADLNSRYDALR